MQRTQAAVLVSLEQAQAFLDKNASLLTSVNATDTRKALDDVVAQVSARAADQSTHQLLSKGAQAQKLGAERVLLEEHLRAIAHAAQAQLPKSPELAPLTKAPAARTPTKALIAAAEGMANIAGDHRDVLGAALGSDFLDQLKAATQAVQDLSDAAVSGRTQRTAATAALKAELTRGRQALKVLDPLVKRSLAGNTQLLHEWKGARKITVPVKSAMIAPAAGSTPAPTTGSTTPATATVATPAPTPAQPPAAASPAPVTPSAPPQPHAA